MQFRWQVLAEYRWCDSGALWGKGVSRCPATSMEYVEGGGLRGEGAAGKGGQGKGKGRGSRVQERSSMRGGS